MMPGETKGAPATVVWEIIDDLDDPTACATVRVDVEAPLRPFGDRTQAKVARSAPEAGRRGHRLPALTLLPHPAARSRR